MLFTASHAPEKSPLITDFTTENIDDIVFTIALKKLTAFFQVAFMFSKASLNAPPRIFTTGSNAALIICHAVTATATIVPNKTMNAGFNFLNTSCINPAADLTAPIIVCNTDIKSGSISVFINSMTGPIDSFIFANASEITGITVSTINVFISSKAVIT